MGSKGQAILLEKRDKIAYITFNRPEKLNAIRPADYGLLNDLVNECEKDDNLRAVIMTGNGRAFSAGDDIEGWKGQPKSKEYLRGDWGMLAMSEGRTLDMLLKEYRIPCQETCVTMMKSGKVYIGAINGLCRIPEYLYAMDFVISADIATYAQGDMLAGFCPMAGSTQIATRVLGRRRATELILLADPISAQEAWRVGLVNKVVSLAQLMPEAEALAKKFISYPISGIKLTKMAMTKSQDLSLRDGLELELSYATASVYGGPWDQWAAEFVAKKKKMA
ncbi:MAG: enoyl-CoA hydratase/isomerase family protein [Dehalococcoidia bacterium]|jgi:enoyl-CoA hydratase/carnithine racemase